MSDLVSKILLEASRGIRLNEFLGFSKEEKQKKALKQKVEMAYAEAQKYEPTRLVGQPGGKTPDERNNNMLTIVSIRIKEAKQMMPNLAELLPKLFELKPNSTNAAHVIYKNYHDCIIPSEWYFITGGKQIIDENTCKENFLKYIRRDLSRILKNARIKEKG